jgi:hypothetical protein
MSRCSVDARIPLAPPHTDPPRYTSYNMAYFTPMFRWSLPMHTVPPRYTSNMALDGSQPMSVGMRHDCISETSASFAVRSLMRAKGSPGRPSNATAAAADRTVATNLLNYGMIHGGFSPAWVPGGTGDMVQQLPWTISGDAFGIMSWLQGIGGFLTYRPLLFCTPFCTRFCAPLLHQ